MKYSNLNDLNKIIMAFEDMGYIDEAENLHNYFIKEAAKKKSKKKKNVPNNPSLWAECKAWAKRTFDVYPSAYANGAAAKRYKEKGGTWRKASKDNVKIAQTFRNQELKTADSKVTPMGLSTVGITSTQNNLEPSLPKSVLPTENKSDVKMDVVEKSEPINDLIPTPEEWDFESEDYTYKQIIGKLKSLIIAGDKDKAFQLISWHYSNNTKLNSAQRQALVLQYQRILQSFGRPDISDSIKDDEEANNFIASIIKKLGVDEKSIMTNNDDYNKIMSQINKLIPRNKRNVRLIAYDILQNIASRNKKNSLIS